MFNITLFRSLLDQLDSMVDALEEVDYDLSESNYPYVSDEFPSLLNNIIIELNECSAKLEKLITLTHK